MSSLVHSNEQRWNEQRYLSLCLNSYSHRLANENILQVNILRVYSLRLFLFFKIKHSIKFRAIWLRISGDMTLVSGDMTSGEMTFGRLDRLPSGHYSDHFVCRVQKSNVYLNFWRRCLNPEARSSFFFPSQMLNYDWYRRIHVPCSLWNIFQLILFSNRSRNKIPTFRRLFCRLSLSKRVTVFWSEHRQSTHL